jgi:hypothetical protein
MVGAAALGRLRGDRVARRNKLGAEAVTAVVIIQVDTVRVHDKATDLCTAVIVQAGILVPIVARLALILDRAVVQITRASICCHGIIAVTGASNEVTGAIIGGVAIRVVGAWEELVVACVDANARIAANVAILALTEEVAVAALVNSARVLASVGVGGGVKDAYHVHFAAVVAVGALLGDNRDTDLIRITADEAVTAGVVEVAVSAHVRAVADALDAEHITDTVIVVDA